MGHKKHIGIGFAAGRINFLSVLQAYIYHLKETFHTCMFIGPEDVQAEKEYLVKQQIMDQEKELKHCYLGAGDCIYL